MASMPRLGCTASRVNKLVVSVCTQCLVVRTRVPVSSACTTGSLPRRSLRQVMNADQPGDRLLLQLAEPSRRHRGVQQIRQQLCGPLAPSREASFAPVARHYGAAVAPCPPRRGSRKGAVECGVKFMCGRWWRTMTATTPEQAQVSGGPVLGHDRRRRLRPPGRYAEPGTLVEGERPR